MVGETLGLRDRPLDDLFQFRIALLIRGCDAGQQRTRENYRDARAVNEPCASG
jgi:hypothetical protein